MKAIDKLIKEFQDNPEKFDRLQKIRSLLPLTKCTPLTLDILLGFDDHQLDYFIGRVDQMTKDLDLDYKNLHKGEA